MKLQVRPAFRNAIIAIALFVMWVIGHGMGYGTALESQEVQAAPEITYIRHEALWDVVQQWRADQGYLVYQHDEQACQLAEKRLEEIKTDWSHNGFWDEECVNCSAWGENLARGFYNESDVLTAWLESPTHADNLHDRDYSHSCIRTDGSNTVHFFIGY